MFVLNLYAYNCVLYSCAVFINDSIRVETDNYFVILKYPGVSSSESTIYSFAVLGVEFKFDNCEIWMYGKCMFMDVLLTLTLSSRTLG